MLTLMALLGLIMTGFAVDWAIDAFDDDEDATEETDPDMPLEPVVDPVTDPLPPSAIEGTQNTDDLLTGSADNDTIIGNETDADTLLGGAGNDVLKLSDDNVGTGGEGADTFIMDRGANLSDTRLPTSIRIDDFEPGVDTLEILHEVTSSAHVQPHVTIIEGENTILEFRSNANPDSAVYDSVELTGTTGFSTDDLTISLVDADGAPISTAVPDLSFAIREGTDGDDGIFSLTDPNTIYQVSAGEGDDTVVSYSAIDTVDLGDGNDEYYGYPVLPDGYTHDTSSDGIHSDAYFGVEIVNGGAGDDSINSGYDNTIINGGEGNDLIDILAHDYDVDGGAGNDYITIIQADSHGTASGGDGDDFINGGGGNDTFFGNEGNDALRGYDGNDVLDGGAGSDFLSGGDGDDTLHIAENDTATGGTGADVFHASRVEDGGGPVAPRITDFEADIDLVELELTPDVHNITGIQVTYDATTDETSIYADGVLSLVMEGDNTGLSIAFTNTQPNSPGAPTVGYHDADGNAVDSADVDVKIYLWRWGF